MNFLTYGVSLADDENVWLMSFWDFLVARETKTGKEKMGKLLKKWNCGKMAKTLRK